MMGRWPFNRRETFQVVGWMVILLGALPRWVDLLEKLGVDVARLAPYLELLQRARWLIVGVAAVGLLCVLARPLRAALGGWQWGRKRYVRALAWLAKPVQEEVEAGLRDASTRAVLDEAGAALPGLGIDALKVLQFSLAALDSVDVGPCLLVGSQVLSGSFGGYAVMIELSAACNELVTAGFVSRHERDWDHLGARVWLRSEIQVADQGGELSRLVREELERRGA